MREKCATVLRMASLNVAEWTPEQVAEWLSGECDSGWCGSRNYLARRRMMEMEDECFAGLGPSVERYAAALRARGLDGAKLLTLRCDDLEYLGVHVIGHQELLLEAVEHLRNFVSIMHAPLLVTWTAGLYYKVCNTYL